MIVHLAFAVVGSPTTPITLVAVGPPVAVLAYLQGDPGADAAAARLDGRRDLAVLAASPLVQLSVPVAFVMLEQWFATRGGV